MISRRSFFGLALVPAAQASPADDCYRIHPEAYHTLLRRAAMPTDAKLREACAVMRARGIPADSWMLYGVKHGLFPAEWAKNLADTYKSGCPNCGERFE